jgi:hypothetical protein
MCSAVHGVSAMCLPSAGYWVAVHPNTAHDHPITERLLAPQVRGASASELRRLLAPPLPELAVLHYPGQAKPWKYVHLFSAGGLLQLTQVSEETGPPRSTDTNARVLN